MRRGQKTELLLQRVSKSGLEEPQIVLSARNAVLRHRR